MNIVVVSGSNVGEKTSIAANKVMNVLKEKYSEDNSVNLLDLKELTLEFSDGRNYLDYTGDTKYVTQTLMNADIIFFGTPIFQASIPASLKNLFDLLPQKAFEYKTCSIVTTAGSNKHYLIPEQQLKPILGYMKANIVPNYVYILDTDFDNGEIINDDIHFRIDKLVEDTIVLAKAYKDIWAQQEDSYGF
ncbi:NADPH-dependent FMN reductase [Marinilactibacillus psychrotolerans]|uniref:FMN reductase n=1 Tax=Marinilactibacillus psychrotolerans TaxID=191770 RepID=A0AAV3WVC4_9LACT|nr:NADPH-dependent FMN reductase [Marinilactibacillus psychrotolerans]GEL67887.1 FMN reductase [Marinilactibacillus psychrotolerans]GEQ36107.1 FMN reductase [Marinilactibacillus psychrotolerans]SDC63965.1 FMN reductase [Marinilactibacillus psychrotolerans]